jgi:hypothetical protein
LWEFAQAATEQAPFAARPIARGEVIDDDAIEWRRVPAGLFTSIDPMGTAAVAVIQTGDPVTASVITQGVVVPADWWTVAADIPVGAVRGSSVRVVLSDGFGVTGVVVEPSADDNFGIASAGLLAVPPEAADLVALAASSGDLVVLFEP